jgi:hypothetical protein
VGRTHWPAGAHYAYRDDGHELTLFVPTVTDGQIRDLCQGCAEVAMVLDSRKVVLSIRFGASLPWSRSEAFHWRQRPLSAASLLPASWQPASFHAQLHVALVDADTGIIRAVRGVFLCPSFTQALNAAAHARDSQGDRVSESGDPVARIYRSVYDPLLTDPAAPNARLMSPRWQDTW